MINFQKKIEEIQNQPYEARIKILWAVVIVCAATLFLIWIFSLKNTFSNINSKNLIQPPAADSKTAESESQFAEVERVERAGDILKIYFNFNNPTDDILNVPKLENITLDAENIHPAKITDRQGGAFVQKVLSHTQNFGVLTFGKVSADSGKLTFDEMFFEKNPEKVFKQTLDLDFNKLLNNAQLRN